MSEFWMEKPCALINDLRPLPTDDMTKDQKLNALSRLILLITLYLYWNKNQYWQTFLGVGLVAVVVMKYSDRTCGVREGFSVNPTYSGTDFTQTIVAPTFAEEWQNPPPQYDLIETLTSVDDLFESTVDLDPRSYPYGQYLTKTNLLPADEFDIHKNNRGLTKTREFMNNSYTRRDVAFRDDIMRIHKKKLARRFRNNCNDNFSPYHSY